MWELNLRQIVARLVNALKAAESCLGTAARALPKGRRQASPG